MEEASDTDSGIMLHSGPDSPVPPLKELTQAVRQQQRELEARLDACVQELRRLCVREAELTGTLPREFPLKAGEKPPTVRRRIGAAFKLDETLVLRGADPLSALERELALQLQIARAARRLSREENIGKQLRKRRQSAALREESKLRELESTLRQCRLLAALPGADAPGASDDSSVSGPDEEAAGTGSPSPPPPSRCPAEETRPPPPPPEGLPCSSVALDCPVPHGIASGARPPYRLVAMGSLVLCHRLGSSAPGTPELPGRRGAAAIRAFAKELPAEAGSEAACCEPAESRGRSAPPRRRPTYYTVTVPAYCFPAPAASNDSNSEGSGRGSERAAAPARYQRLVASRSRIVRTPSLKEAAVVAGARALSRAAVCEELQWWHERARLRGARPRSLDRQGLPRGPPRPPGPAELPGTRGRAQVPHIHVLKRSPDGRPVQLYVPENGEIVTQV